jgi:MarR-like DNA-binding transcriptional regulator SgrR of sgrS sRNA
MSAKNDKQLRGQLRQLVRELLPELLSEQLIQSIEKRLVSQLQSGLNKIDDRQSQLQSYIVRNAGVPSAPKASS